jgi:SAM-dependent methyltransferase
LNALFPSSYKLGPLIALILIADNHNTKKGTEVQQSQITSGWNECVMRPGRLSNPNPYDEGLGTVYERFMLNRLFEKLLGAFSISEVLEVPFFGMTGLTGINSVYFANRGCNVTLVDTKPERIAEAEVLWDMLGSKDRCRIYCEPNLSRLPFQNGQFELAWNFAAMWHTDQPDMLLAEMARVSSHLLLIVVPNKKQVGYFLRKYILDRDFFHRVDENWAGLHRVQDALSSLSLKMIERGVVDVPPWPDTCMPVGDILSKFRPGKSSANLKSSKRWNWDIVQYYLGADETLKERVEKLSFIETLPISWQLKRLWAHHEYVLFSKN